MAFLPGGREVLTAQNNGSLAVWQADSGEWLHAIGDSPSDPSRRGSILGIHDVQLAPEGGTAWWAADDFLGLRDLATGKDLKLFRTGLPAHMFTTHLSVSPEGDWLAVGRCVWDAGTGEAITHGLEETIAHGFESISAMSPDGRLFAFPWGRKIIVWEALSRTQVGTLDTDRMQIHDMAFSPDGTVLAAAAEGGTLLWDMTGRLRKGGGWKRLS